MVARGDRSFQSQGIENVRIDGVRTLLELGKLDFMNGESLLRRVGNYVPDDCMSISKGDALSDQVIRLVCRRGETFFRERAHIVYPR